MAIQHQLDHTLELIPVAGGMDVNGSLVIKPNQSPNSINFRHRSTILIPRSNLDTYISASPAVPGYATITNPITRLHQADFENESSYLAIHSKSKFYIFDGTTLTDATNSVITGSPTDLQPWTSTMALGFYVFANGVSETLYLKMGQVVAYKIVAPGTGETYVDNANGSSLPLVARYVAGFAGRLILGFTTESTARAHRVRWCDDSNLFSWYAGAGLGAGAVDLLDTGKPITGLRSTIDALYVFKGDALVIGRETGDFRTPIAFPTILNIGCLSGQSIQPISPTAMIFLGTDDFYLLSGSDTRSIGFPIRKQFFNDLDQKYLRQIVSFTIPEETLYVCCIPSQNDSVPRKAYVYNWSENLWWTEYYSSGIQAAAQSTIAPGASLQTIDHPTSGAPDNIAVGISDKQINTVSATIDSFISGQSRTRILVSSRYTTNDYRVLQLANNSTIDNILSPSTIQCLYETKDFEFNPNQRSILYGIWVYFESAVTGTLYVSVSTDRGKTFSQAVAASPSNSNRIYLNLRFSGRFHRVQLQVYQQAINISYIELIHGESRSLY